MKKYQAKLRTTSKHHFHRIVLFIPLESGYFPSLAPTSFLEDLLEPDVTGSRGLKTNPSVGNDAHLNCDESTSRNRLY